MKTTRPVALATTLFAFFGIQAGTPATAVAQAGNAVEIPLSTRAGRMVVPVRAADGSELLFLVSTGSAVTVLSESGAAKIGDGGATMGGLAINMDGAQTLPDDRLTVDGMVMDGLVSNSTLNEYDILFDVPGGRLVLKPFGRAVEWPGMHLSDPVTLRIYHGVVVALDVQINGSPYQAMLELGAPALLANEALLEQTGITDGLADLTLGSVTLDGLPIELSDHPSIGRFTSPGEGFVIIGGPPVQNCAISLSWVHRELRTCVR